MQYVIAVLILAFGLLFICAMGTNLDVLKQHSPKYQPFTVQVGPVSYSGERCIENCPR